MIRPIAALAAALALLASLEQARSATPRPAPVKKPPAAPRVKASPAAAPASFDLGVWTIHASSLDANFKNGDFSTPKKIVMTRVGGDVTADRANGNYKKQVLYLDGHVVMHDDQGGASGLTGASPGPPSPSTLTADKAQIDGTAKIYKAIGNVHYVQSNTSVTADNGTLDDAAHNLLLQGSVHVVDGARKMSAQTVLYNTQSGTAHAEGDVTIQFPSEFHRGLATPKPLRIPKNPVTQPVGSAGPP